MKGPRFRILIAERNPHVRAFIGRELARSNLLVVGARNSDEIFSVLESAEPPHLVVLAVDVPNTGGAELLRRIVARHPHVPVVLLAYHEELGEQDALHLAAGIVEKNGNPELLTSTVIKLLGRLHEGLCAENFPPAGE